MIKGRYAEWLATHAATLFTSHGTYIITAVTLHRKPLFDSSGKLDLVRDTTFELAKDYALTASVEAAVPAATYM